MVALPKKAVVDPAIRYWVDHEEKAVFQTLNEDTAVIAESEAGTEITIHEYNRLLGCGYTVAEDPDGFELGNEGLVTVPVLVGAEVKELDAAEFYQAQRNQQAEEGDAARIAAEAAATAPQPVAPATPPAPFSLASARRTSEIKRPPITLIYGMEKRGKTSLALSFPEPFLITAGNEAPPQGLDVACTPGPVKSFEDLMQWLRTFAKEKHTYRTLVLDSLSRIEPLVHDYVVRTMQLSDSKAVTAKTIEDFGYGKGYVQADIAWDKIMGALTYLNRVKGMGIVNLAHATVKQVKEPLTEGYDSYILDLNKRAVDLFKRESDAVLFLRENVGVTEKQEGMQKRKMGTGGRLIYCHTSSAAAYTGGTRYKLPDKILIEEGKGYQNLVEAGFPVW